MFSSRAELSEDLIGGGGSEKTRRHPNVVVFSKKKIICIAFVWKTCHSNVYTIPKAAHILLRRKNTKEGRARTYLFYEFQSVVARFHALYRETERG